MIPTKGDQAELDRLVANFLSYYDQASEEQRARGDNWYAVAHSLAVMLGDGDAKTGAGVLAALSANISWSQNVALAEDACSGNIHGHTGVTLAKVEKILNGQDPQDVLPMEVKTGNFYRCILDPDDADAVVVDRHVYDIADGQAHGNDDRGLSNKNRYAFVALALRMAAFQRDIIPQRFQAIVWTRRLDQKEKGLF